MKVITLVLSNRYYDSVSLMLITREASAIEEISGISIVMGTPHNISQLESAGLLTDKAKDADPNDLIIAMGIKDDADEGKISEKVLEILNRKKDVENAQDFYPRSLRTALKIQGDCNIALISVPGAWAPRVARQAMKKGLHTMLFSDNISLEDEIKLKEEAISSGLLMMGPDCGTAILGGVPLAFANDIGPGPVGIVGASGTGIQELTVQLAHRGIGITNAIGTGGRDLSDKVGGKMAMAGLSALAQDPNTKIICLISKPPAPKVAKKMISFLENCGKPAVLHLLGMDDNLPQSDLIFGENIAHTAQIIAHLVNCGENINAYREVNQNCKKNINCEKSSLPKWNAKDLEIDPDLIDKAKKLPEKRKYIRGLFCGGTLANEAQRILKNEGFSLYSNIADIGIKNLENPEKSLENTIIDMGEDHFTKNRAHPMIDPWYRAERMKKELEDPDIAILFVDIILGSGSYSDPSYPIAQVAQKFFGEREKGGNSSSPCDKGPLIIAYLCGTMGDYQNFEEQEKKLRDAGIFIAKSNAHAAYLVSQLAKITPYYKGAEVGAKLNQSGENGKNGEVATPSPLPKEKKDENQAWYFEDKGPKADIGKKLEIPQDIRVVNIGLESFAQDLNRLEKPNIHMQWSPPAWGDHKLAQICEKLLED